MSSCLQPSPGGRSFRLRARYPWQGRGAVEGTNWQLAGSLNRKASCGVNIIIITINLILLCKPPTTKQVLCEQVGAQTQAHDLLKRMCSVT